jgi:hypothetical protein
VSKTQKKNRKRIGERGARNWKEEREDVKRKSKDKVENAEGKKLMGWIEENGWEVCIEREQTRGGSRGMNLYR